MSADKRKQRRRAPIAPLIIGLCVIAIVAGCQSGPATPGTSSNPLAAETNLLFEGSCQFLACCSCWATEHTEPTPGTFSCSGFQGCPPMSCDPRKETSTYAPTFYCKEDDTSCHDSDLWLVKPGLTRSECGKRYLICYKGQTVEVPLKDKSDSNQKWEASSGVFTALGLKAGANPKVRIYSNPDDAAIDSDPECNCTLTCLANLHRRCGGKGSCSVLIQNGNPSKATQTYANGIRAEGQFGGGWVDATVYRDDTACYRIVQLSDGAGGTETTFSAPDGKTIAAISIKDGKATVSCDGKSSTVATSELGCVRSLFLTECNP